MIRGQCLCGGVRFEVESVDAPFELCHCLRCRKASGSAFMAMVSVRNSAFRIVRGTDLISSYEAPILYRPPAYRVSFCSRCGSPVPNPQPDEQYFEIPAGLIDDELMISPDKHIFVDCKSSWYNIEDSLPQLSRAQLIQLRMADK